MQSGKAQSTHSGNGHFLAYIPSRWKNLVMVGGVTISTITYKVMVYAPAEREDTLPLFLLYNYMYSVRKGKPSFLKYLWSGDWVSWE
jgi:hypothetical protein